MITDGPSDNRPDVTSQADSEASSPPPILEKPVQAALKRAFDVVSCSAVAVAAAPLFPILAALVKLDSPGPVLFVQERSGLGGRTFDMYKFRTMRAPTAGHDPTQWTPEHVERITRFGKIMRDYGLDELPQLINILRGDMSVVGARPPLPVQVEQYTPRQRRMLDMKPGVLSLAVIRGRRSIPIEERIEHHIEYVERWSLWLDMEIFVRSIGVVLGRRDAEEQMTTQRPTSP